jgi:hypothetical protein
MRRLLDRWLAGSADNRSAALWRRWYELLELPVAELEEFILTDRDHQLIQCSPMGAVITPQERFAVYRELTAAGR